MHNALSVFVSDWYHQAGADHPSGISGELESRVRLNTQNTLAFLARLKTKATFFILGVVAERFPELVKNIEVAGHEVASMGFRYREVFRHTEYSFRDDLRKSLELLRSISGTPVQGYHAPDFSIIPRVHWALDMLGEEGVKYDCSLFPVHHWRFGNPHTPRVLYRVRPNVIECPPTTLRMAWTNVSVAGSRGLCRWPSWLVRSMVERLNRQGMACHFFVHVWEFDEDLPKIPVSLWRRWAEFADNGLVQSRLTDLLSHFQFVPVWEVVERTIGEDEIL